MSIRALRNTAIFLTAALFSTAAYAADGTATVAGIDIPTRVIVAVVGCILVRIFIWSESKNKLAVYNLSISAIAVLGSGVYAFEHVTGLTEAFGTGLGVGAGAVALVEAAKSRALTVIKDTLRSWLNKP
ncbi:hypothetical protein C8J25_101880 [Sphingomonas faeni]|uniref:Holin n=1 Tax=Sphingomonas faeni TaxID=185950 RepID=A0A2T5UCX9_9SPHN|nr:hypothetical protein [Sphingomonas faeni]PTW49372.1 hypothetical protein C8J25_101880 [Sphingomonas faeni]